MRAKTDVAKSLPRRHGRALVRVTGVLDLDAAVRLAESLAAHDHGERFRIDLRHASAIHDVAIVTLARALRPHDAVLVGLSRHHERLLGYVGGAGPAMAR